MKTRRNLGRNTTVSNKSARRKTVNRKSASNKSKYNNKSDMSNEKQAHIVRVLIEILNLVKLYHWKTHSFAQHKATDELYEKLNENIDRFVEVLLGKKSSRIHMVSQRIQLMDQNLKTFKEKIYEFRSFLVDLNNIFTSKQDTDLLSIRDDILADINQFLYLLTFDK